MKLQCFHCDAILTPDMAVEFGGRDFCPPCHDEIGAELEALARAQQSAIRDEIDRATIRFCGHPHEI